MLSEPILVLARLVRIFDALGIRYLVGGSLASSLYGIPRATQDVDLVADLELSHVDGLSAALSGGFYADAVMIRDAVDRHESFNVVDLETMFKADIFVARGDPWSCEEMARARPEQIDVPGGAVSINFASPEDTLLHKMVWYKLGNQTSERQWRDIVGVVKVQGASLEVAYLERWAPTLGVSDLLLRALKEA
ncbi:MAG: nucleotidyl transferase AbiEii/AbiGii toxin family protein [bacterium]|nr:nucleotidyl transferase AbiEii/AbiGii toxin family protein [bacterium]MBK9305355.1 nucleotidyl transferase AbiEii/AbiGii toxin family protein [bacterium]